MRNFCRLGVYLAISLFLHACGEATQIAPFTQATPLQKVTLTPNQTATALIEPSPTRLDAMSSPLLTIAVPDGTNVPSPTPIPKIPTFLPTIEPNSTSEQLRNSLIIQTVEGIYGHNIRQITGWDYGFRQSLCDGYQWLDSNHLLLHPRTGEGMRPFMDGSVRGDLSAEPAVINLTSGTLWLRPLSSVSAYEWDCDQFYWSRELGILINQENYGSTYGPSKEGVSIYTFDGQKVARYWGKILGISPSGAKILVDDDTIIDLSKDKITDLAWYMNYDLEMSPKLYWSSDESRVYRCCFYYADLNTGKSYSFEWSDLRGVDGKPVSFSMHPHSDGQWVRNDSYFFVEWDYWSVWYGDPIPMFSPAEKKYYDVTEMTGIPTSLTAYSTYAVSPDGMYVWIKGYSDADGLIHSFLVNLTTFEMTSYDIPVNDFFWSADSKFGWADVMDSNDAYILSIAGKTLLPFPVNPSYGIASWHPEDHILSYLAENNQTLAFLNANDLDVKRRELPISVVGSFWSPSGDRIAFQSTDGSLWQLDYPGLENLDQLTSPLPNVREIEWSPDGDYLAFVSGTDIYIVDTSK